MGTDRVSPLRITTAHRLDLSAAVVAVCTSDLLRKELEVLLDRLKGCPGIFQQ
ncbi:hypothetical protein EXN66_Car022445 [Channa argus]|uniref:Uncharacterized protein n=1 Tax=Channa argus TaxID=215402 RepID=A0A6G1QWR9_CHAAH|nr:hypothetical protein EXN66_Car022445 [Channa argus]